MQRVFKINVNGTDYDVTVQELTDISSQLMPQYKAMPAPAPSAPTATASATTASATTPSTTRAQAGGGDQCAQMGGVVVNILVKPGQQVNEGDGIVELEAMKMKVPVVAARSGKVASIAVAVGEAVERGQTLLTLA